MYRPFAHSILPALVAAGLAAGIAAPGHAQAPVSTLPTERPTTAATDPRAGTPFAMLIRPEVLTDLGVDAKQKALLARARAYYVSAVRMRIRQARMDMGQDRIHAMTPASRQAWMTNMENEVETRRARKEAEYNAGVRTILTPAQIARLQQIDLQQRGPMCLAEPTFAAEIKVAAPHIAAVRAVTDRFVKQAARLTTDASKGPPNAGALKSKIVDARKQADADALAALSPAERSAWTRALGAPFAFKND